MLLAGAVAPLALAGWLASSLPSAAARTHPRDARATWTYLQTEVALFGALIANSHREQQAGEELVGRLAAECPGVAGSADSRVLDGGTAVERLREETFDAVVVAYLSPDLSLARLAARALSRLSWRRHRLTVLVHHQARAEAATGALRLPDLCGDLETWAAGGYKSVPASTTRFLKRYEATEGGPGLERIWHMLRPYEGPRARALRRHVQRLRERAGRVLDGALIPLVRTAATELGLVVAASGPPALLLQPPPSVVQSGGERLAEFEAGSAVATSSGCLACHRIGEAGNPGPGPDLTHIGSKLTGTQIARALIDAKAPMPSFRNLPRKRFEALVEFLSLLQ